MLLHGQMALGAGLRESRPARTAPSLEGGSGGGGAHESRAQMSGGRSHVFEHLSTLNTRLCPILDGGFFGWGTRG